MFAIPGILLLLAFVYARPQDLVGVSHELPLLAFACALALFGWLVDLRLRKSRPAFAPADAAVAVFVLWALTSLALRRPEDLAREAAALAVPLASYFLLAHAIQSFRAFQLVAGAVLALVVFLAVIGVEQGSSPFGCHVVDPQAEDGAGSYDGRRCDTRKDCESGYIDPNAEYVCERVGLFGTSSVAGGRVRYRGSLADPNELAMVVALGLPFAFALFTRRPGLRRGLVAVLALALVGGCVVYTQSRGGELVFIAVMATYFVRRFGVKGLIAATVVAVPVVLFGWRHDAAAGLSAQERLRGLRVAMKLVETFPLVGVGLGQILGWHTQTIQSSYALVAAELGLPGLVAWVSVLYISAKIPIAALRRYGTDSSTRLAHTWALALCAALVGLGVGVFFLPFAYHQVLWIMLGLCGAYHAACRAHDPELDVRYGLGDLAAVVAGCTLLMLAILAYTQWQSR